MNDGGLSARRAVIRWAWRLFRREWRQQLMVITLLTVAVAAAISGASAAYSLAPLGFFPGKFGAANHAFVHEGSDPQLLQANVASIEAWFGAVDMISRRYVPIPGTAATVEIRAQDPQGAYSAPLLALLEGRFPTGAGEVAVTDSVAKTFDLELDSRFTLAGSERVVIGLVENPSDLRDAFVLVAPAHAGPLTTVTILVRGSEEQFLSFPWPEEGLVSHESVSGPANVQVLSAGAALGVAAVAMVLVSLVASAGFIVVAQRRQRQLGMLAAIGANEKHLRLVMLANGVMVGVLAATVGAALGLAGWIAVVPYLETSLVGARIDRFDVLPWWLVGAGMLLAVVAATIAAWWPARAVARLPVIVALSGRPSRPQPVRPAAARAGLILAGGLFGLAVANAGPVGWLTAPLMGLGTLVTILGMLLFSPVAIRALAMVAGGLPVGVRLALRDLDRYQARSAAALAAISLALGIAAAVIIVATRAEYVAKLSNLSGGQFVVTWEGSRIRELVTVRTPEEVERMQARVEQLAGPLDDHVVIALQMAVDPGEAINPGRAGTPGWRHAVEVGDGALTANPGPLFVATPELLKHYGIDPATVDPDTDVFTVRMGEIGFRRGIQETLVTNVERLDIAAYASAPTSLITLDALRRRGWEAAHVGWLVEGVRPISSGQLAAALDLAESAGLRIEFRDEVSLALLRSLRAGAMAVGTGVALIILGMTVGLIRSEAAADLRTLTAAGASDSIRRTLTAATAGTLAVLGVLLGTAGAYLGLAATFVTELDTLAGVPVRHLSIVAIGVPLLAAAAGWLLSGRQPSTLARSPID